jgi:hypothetical protein
MPKLKTTTSVKFVAPSVASETFGCTERHLRNLQSFWKYGEHYIDLRAPDSPRAAYRYSIEKVAEWFSLAPEMRG